MKHKLLPSGDLNANDGTLAPATRRSLDKFIKRYQYDIVGWTEFCVTNVESTKRMPPEDSQGALEFLRTQERFNDLTCAPPVEKIYSDKESYIQWHDEEYERDRAFYQCVLRRSKEIMVALGLRTDVVDEIKLEVDRDALNYLDTLEQKKSEEISRIMTMPESDWSIVRSARYPKVQLGCLLGADPEAIVVNFGIYLVCGLQGEFHGSKSAFLSASGPTLWQMLGASKAELAYFKENVLSPSITPTQLPEKQD